MIGFVKMPKAFIKKLSIAVKVYNKPKIICIGKNKTGTTSMKELLRQYGYVTGNQQTAERMLKPWINREFDSLIRHVRYGGEAFQDIPFSLPDTYKVLDRSLNKARFILTIRDSAEEWYKSLTGFHAKYYGNGKTPTKAQLLKVDYIYPGWMWDALKNVHNAPDDDPYNKEILIRHYNEYNSEVIEYFKERPGKLLVVNLKEDGAAAKIASFLGKERIIEIPWENKT